MPHGFREEDFFKAFPYYKTMETLDPQSGATLDPRVVIGRIYVGDHLILLHHKYISEGLMVSEKKICTGFPTASQ